jgi:hypothetical protein
LLEQLGQHLTSEGTWQAVPKQPPVLHSLNIFPERVQALVLGLVLPAGLVEGVPDNVHAAVGADLPASEHVGLPVQGGDDTHVLKVHFGAM